MWLLMFVDFEAKKFPPEDWIYKECGYYIITSMVMEDRWRSCFQDHHHNPKMRAQTTDEMFPIFNNQTDPHREHGKLGQSYMYTSLLEPHNTGCKVQGMQTKTN